MVKHIVPLLLSLLTLGISGCMGASAEENALPTPIPRYTEAPAVRSIELGADTEATTPEEVLTEAETLDEEVEEAVEQLQVEDETASQEPSITEEEAEEEDTAGEAVVEQEPDLSETVGETAEPDEAGEAPTLEIIVPAVGTANAQPDDEEDRAGETAESIEVTPVQAEGQPASTPTPGAATGEADTLEQAESDEVAEGESAAGGAESGEEPAEELPAEIAQALAQADPAHGEALIVSTGCTACHSFEEGVRLVGPSWYNLANQAETRVAGQSAAVYLYNSILHPNQHVVEEYQPNLMPMNYGDILDDQELADVIAYLLTLRGEEGE